MYLNKNKKIQCVHPPSEDTVDLGLSPKLPERHPPHSSEPNLANFNCIQNMIWAAVKLNTERELNKLYIMGFKFFF